MNETPLPPLPLKDWTAFDQPVPVSRLLEMMDFAASVACGNHSNSAAGEWMREHAEDLMRTMRDLIALRTDTTMRITEENDVGS